MVVCCARKPIGICEWLAPWDGDGSGSLPAALCCEHQSIYQSINLRKNAEGEQGKREEEALIESAFRLKVVVMMRKEEEHTGMALIAYVLVPTSLTASVFRSFAVSRAQPRFRNLKIYMCVCVCMCVCHITMMHVSLLAISPLFLLGLQSRPARCLCFSFVD